MSHMSPEQFSMWLRGAFDAVGEGQAIPADVAARIHDRLTDVVAGQVAKVMKSNPFADQAGVTYPIGRPTVTTTAPYPYGISGGATTPESSNELLKAETALKIEELRYQKDMAIAQMKYAK